MSQRNLPASFWICDYYHQHSQQLLQQQHAAATAAQQQQQYDPYDAYVSAAADPWHNYMYHQHAHRSASDMYSQASRQYSSLLHLQSSAIARQAHQQGRQVAAALGKGSSGCCGQCCSWWILSCSSLGSPTLLSCYDRYVTMVRIYSLRDKNWVYTYKSLSRLS